MSFLLSPVFVRCAIKNARVLWPRRGDAGEGGLGHMGGRTALRQAQGGGPFPDITPATERVGG